METSSYMILHLLTTLNVTNLSKKFPNDILPGKNHVSLKKLSSLGISVESYKIYFPNVKDSEFKQWKH